MGKDSSGWGSSCKQEINLSHLSDSPSHSSTSSPSTSFITANQTISPVSLTTDNQNLVRSVSQSVPSTNNQMSSVSANLGPFSNKSKKRFARKPKFNPLASTVHKRFTKNLTRKTPSSVAAILAKTNAVQSNHISSLTNALANTLASMSVSQNKAITSLTNTTTSQNSTIASLTSTLINTNTTLLNTKSNTAAPTTIVLSASIGVVVGLLLAKFLMKSN